MIEGLAISGEKLKRSQNDLRIGEVVKVSGVHGKHISTQILVGREPCFTISRRRLRKILPFRVYLRKDH